MYSFEGKRRAEDGLFGLADVGLRKKPYFISPQSWVRAVVLGAGTLI